MIQKIIKALEDYDYDTVEELLPTIPTDPVEIFCRTSADILESCSDAETFQYITEILERINPYSSNTVHVLNLIITFSGSTLVIELMKQFCPNITHIDFIDQWISFEGGYFDNIGLACSNYIEVYGPIGLDTMKQFLKELEDNRKDEFYNVMFGFYSVTSDYAPRPEWISDYKVNDKELNHKLVELTKQHEDIIAPGQLVDRVFNEIGDYIEEGKDELSDIFNHLGTGYLATISEMLKPDVNMTCYYGPANPFTWTHDHVQERMFLCSVYDTDDTGEEQYWFGGSCDECGTRIREEHYAVRLPELNGGWSGCYCSWKCVKDRDPENDLIEKYKEEIEKSTVYDR